MCPSKKQRCPTKVHQIPQQGAMTYCKHDFLHHNKSNCRILQVANSPREYVPIGPYSKDDANERPRNNLTHFKRNITQSISIRIEIYGYILIEFIQPTLFGSRWSSLALTILPTISASISSTFMVLSVTPSHTLHVLGHKLAASAFEQFAKRHQVSLSLQKAAKGFMLP